MDEKRKEEILLSNYSLPNIDISKITKEEMIDNEQIKEVITKEEFKKLSDEVLGRELP